LLHVVIIATTCGSRTALDVIDMGHSGSEARFVDTGLRAKGDQVTDWQFAYYSVEGTESGLPLPILRMTDCSSSTAKNGAWMGGGIQPVL